MRTTVIFDNIPTELRELAQFVLWRWGIQNGNPTKIPHGVHGYQIDVTSPENWSTFEAVRKAYNNDTSFSGIGFAMAKNDPFVGVDLDHCLSHTADTDKSLREITVPVAREIVDILDTYTEITPSGDGLRLWVIAPEGLPPYGRKKGDIEVYQDGRFLTLTGNIWQQEKPIATRQSEILLVHNKVFGPAPEPAKPRPATAISDLTLSDQELFKKMFDSANGSTIRALWSGSWQGAYTSQSEADSALAFHLAFWCNGDEARMDSLFRQSGLYREKWDKIHHSSGATYGAHTIARAIARVQEGYQATVTIDTSNFGNFVNIVNATENVNNNQIDTYSSSPNRGKSPFASVSESVDNVDKIAKIDESAEWQQLIPLGVHNLPPFPVDAFPLWLSDFVSSVAEATQTPADLCAMLSLSALATCLAKRVQIEPRPGWREQVNLYAAIFLPPGNRKSAVLKAVTAPLSAAEREQLEQSRLDAARRETERRVLEQERGAAERAAANAADVDNRFVQMERAKAKAAELVNLPATGEYRLFTEDCTPEKLVTLLADNDGRMAVLTDEGDTFDLMSGRYSEKANLGVYLKSYSGETLMVDRIGRKSERVENPALTIGMAVQPEILRGLLTNSKLRGRGLLGRFLYSIPTDLLGYRNMNAQPVPNIIEASYRGGISTILGMGLTLIAPTVLRLSENADAALRDYERAVEAQLRPGELLGDIRDWGGKLLGQVCRIAALIHIAAHAQPAIPLVHMIEESTMLAAIRIGGYLAAHARAAFSEMGADEELDQAQMLVEYIRTHDLEEVTQRDLYRSLARRFKRPEDMAGPLTLLVARNYVREIQRDVAGESGRGRKPTPVLQWNPALFTTKKGVM